MRLQHTPCCYRTIAVWLLLLVHPLVEHSAVGMPPASQPPGGVVRLIGRLKGHGGNQVCFSPDGSLLLTAGASDVQIWDARTLAPLGKPLEYPADFVSCGFVAGGRLAFVAHNKGITLWDPRTGRRVGAGVKSQFPVWAASLSPDGRIAAVSCAVAPSVYPEPFVHLFNTSTGKELRRLQHSHGVIFAAFSPDGRSLLTMDKIGMASCAFHVWNVASGRERFAPIEAYCDANCPPGSDIHPAGFSPDGTRIVVSAGALFAVIDLATGKRLCGDVPGDWGGGNHGVSFTADGKWVWCHGLTYNAQTGERAKFPYVREAISSFSLSPHGMRLAGVYTTGTGRDQKDRLGLWDGLTGKQMADFGKPGDNDAIPEFSPSGDRVAVTGVGADQDDTTIWSLEEPQP